VCSYHYSVWFISQSKETSRPEEKPKKQKVVYRHAPYKKPVKSEYELCVEVLGLAGT